MTFYSSTNHKSQNFGFYDRKFRDLGSKFSHEICFCKAAGVHRYLRKVTFYPLTASSLALTYLRTVLLWKNNEINAIGVAIKYLMASIIIVRIINENK